MTDLSADRIDEIVDSLARERKGEIPLVELLGLSKLMIESLESLIAGQDEELSREVNSIARHIERTQVELGQIPPSNATAAALPDADGDLREVVRSTETATHTILESAERIMSADAEDMDSYRQVVDEAVVSIFEACCFQDLTGQRIRRVVDTLSYINQHIGYVMNVIEGGGQSIPKTPTREERGLLGGPQPAGTAISQEEADSVFYGRDDNVVALRN